MKKAKWLAAMTVLFLCTGEVPGVQAQEEESDKPVFMLDSMVVEGSRENVPGNLVSYEGNWGRLGNRNVKDVPFAQTNFTQKTIDTFNDPSAALTSVLVNTPGVKSSSYTLYNDFSIRGLGMTGYNLYVNGVPGMFSQSTIPTNFVERVELVEGPAMAFNGTTTRQSAGGIVNMTTKRAGDTDVTRYTQSFSGSSSFGEAIDVSRRFGEDKEWGVRVNAENVSGEELSGVGEDLTNRDIFVNIDHQGEKSKTNLFAGYLYSKLKNSTRWFQFLSPAAANELTNKKDGVDYTGVTHLPDAPDSDMNYAYDGQGAALDRWMVVLNHEQKINDNWTAFVNAGFSRYDLYDNETGRSSDPYKVINNAGDFHSLDRQGPLAITNYYAEVGVKGQAYTGDVKHDMVFSLDKSWSTQWSGASGSVDAFAGNIYGGRYDNLTPAVGDAGISLSSKNAFWGWAAIDTLEYKKLQVMLGVHGQEAKTKSYSKGALVSTVEGDATSPIYGIVYRPNDKVSFYANHAESFSGGTAVTNVKYENQGEILDPAKTKQNEIGVKYEAGNTLFSLSYFDIKCAKTAEEYRSGFEKPFLVQDGEDEYEGIELTVNGKLAPKWNIMGGLMYLDARRNKTGDGTYDGYRVNGASRWNGVLALEYEANNDFSVIGRALYNGTATINNEELKVPSYFTFDLGVEWKTKLGNTPMTLRAMCYNVTDENYWIAQSGANYLALSNPRTFMLSASFDL